MERHLADKHSDQSQLVKVIREPETTSELHSNNEEEDLPDIDGNFWKCNICDFKCILKTAITSHTATEHNEKCQYKCNMCSYKTVGKFNFDQHLSSKHPTEISPDFTLMYQRIKGNTSFFVFYIL